MQALLLVLAVTLLASAAQGAEAAPSKGKCLLEVNGRTYIRGPCNIEPLDNGGFIIEKSAFFAYVEKTEKTATTARGLWNELASITHARSPLGTLTRNGACWSNQKAKVCAWR